MQNQAKSLFLLTTALATSIAPAWSVPLNMVTAGNDVGQSIETRIDTEKMGLILLRNGLVKMQGKNITVHSVPEWLFDRHKVLSGKMISSKFAGAQIAPNAAGQASTISGLVYFFEGDYLTHLDKTRSKDSITLTDGRVFTGKVASINDASITFQTLPGGKIAGTSQDFQFNEIKLLDSPRAYFFSIPVSDVKLTDGAAGLSADAKAITFVPTGAFRKTGWFNKTAKAVEPKSTLPGTEGGPTKAQIATLVMLDIINDISPAIIAPIVGAYGSSSANKYLQQFNIQQNASGAPVFPYGRVGELLGPVPQN